MHSFKIGKHNIGFDQPLYFIADIAANHDGDLGRAYQLIELAKESGAHAAKFQNFKASTFQKLQSCKVSQFLKFQSFKACNKKSHSIF